MASLKIKDAPAQVPEGYAAIPASADQQAAALRLCIIVKQQADPVTGHLVLLRDLLDAQVYLGCVIDVAGQVQQWVEIWVQDPAGLAKSFAATREATSNDILDRRWARLVESYQRLDPTTLIHTVWETAHPLPTFLDLEHSKAFHPMDGDHPWRLCRDDSLLASRSLPAYTTSLHRYLYVEAAGANSAFVPVTPDAPANEATKSLVDILGGNKDLVPFNPGGGLMLVRAYSSVSFESYIDLVSGAAATGIPHGRSALHLRADAPAGDDQGALAAEGWLYLGKHGKSGRLLETLHLKLRAIADAVEAVHNLIGQYQLPLLNVSADSFQVRLAESGGGLPTLWTSRLSIVDPGDAMELPIEGSQLRYFVPGRPARASIYRPAIASQPIQGRCAVRIRQILPDVSGGAILEGTFATHERIDANKNDLVWLRMTLGAGAANLFARMEQQTALAAGEYRFRTVPQRFSAEANNQLKAAVGVPIANTPFEVLSLLSSPCDLYALAVLSVQALLVSATTPLPVALDETLSLARQLAVEHDSAIPLGQRIGAVFSSDPRWVQSLGPHHLVHQEIAPEEAFDLIPSEVWYDALATIVRMFPGVGPDSICADYGDAPAGGIHKIFEPILADMASLLVRTRSLIVIDWRANREIHAVIRHYLTGLAEEAAVSGPLAGH